MEQFRAEHEKNYPEIEIDGLGNPDSGTGWYSRGLTLKQWDHMNSEQRVFLNMLEGTPFFFILAPIAGLYFPVPVIVFQSIIIVARVAYRFMYKTRGAPVSLIFCSNLALVIMSLWSAAQIVQVGQFARTAEMKQIDILRKRIEGAKNP